MKTTVLKQAAFVLESVGHLRGMEATCLPIAEALRVLDYKLEELHKQDPRYDIVQLKRLNDAENVQ